MRGECYINSDKMSKFSNALGGWFLYYIRFNFFTCL